MTVLSFIGTKMADESKPSDDAPQAEKKSSGMLGLALIPVVGLAVSFGVTYFLAPAPSEPVAAVAACEDTSAHAPVITATAKADQYYVELPEILITIGSEPATRYLKMNVTIATASNKADIVKDAEPVILDSFLNYLRAIELSEFEDPSFYGRMREQLARRSELVVGPAASDGVLITEFLLR